MMAITKSPRQEQPKVVPQIDPNKEAEIQAFYTAPARKELGELVDKPAKKKRVKNPNKTEFLQSMDNDLLERIQVAAKKRRLTRQAWIIQACLAYLGEDI